MVREESVEALDRFIPGISDNMEGGFLRLFGSMTEGVVVLRASIVIGCSRKSH